MVQQMTYPCSYIDELFRMFLAGPSKLGAKTKIAVVFEYTTRVS
jgi:hypothetical protein